MNHYPPPRKVTDGQVQDLYLDDLSRRLARIATTAAIEIETIGARRLERLLNRTLESPGPEGDAVRGLVRLSRAVNRFSAESVVDDADWHRPPGLQIDMRAPQ